MEDLDHLRDNPGFGDIVPPDYLGQPSTDGTSVVENDPRPLADLPAAGDPRPQQMHGHMFGPVDDYVSWSQDNYSGLHSLVAEVDPYRMSHVGAQLPDDGPMAPNDGGRTVGTLQAPWDHGIVVEPTFSRGI